MSKFDSRQPVHALVGRIGRAADEQRLADLVLVRIADHGLQEILLVEGVPERAAHGRIVERLVQMVEAKDVLAADRAQRHELDVLVGLEQAVQVEGRRLDEVDLAGKQRIDGLQMVGHGVPFDAVDLGDLAAGQPRDRLGARLVVGIADIDGNVARPPQIAL